MKDTDTIILKAFLAALLQQTEPLPPEIQTQLNDLAPNLEEEELAHNLEEAIGELEVLAEQYKPLHVSLQATLKDLEAPAVQRSLGFSSNPQYEQSDPLTTELENIAYPIPKSVADPIRQSVAAIESQSELKPGFGLLERMREILTASDSCKAAKDTIIVPLQY
jgi:hypothetical protein